MLPLDSANNALVVKGSPEYVRIYKELREKIVSLSYLPNEKIPSEKELCDQYDVSRYTVRHALQLLVLEGLIVRRQGKASYVRPLSGDDTEGLQKHKLHLACLNQPEVLLTQFLYKFARRVEELTSGTVQVQIHHSSEFGTGTEEVQAVMDGKVDFFGGAVEWLAQLDPAYAVGSYPFLFRDTEHVRLFLQHPVVGRIRNNLVKKYGLRILTAGWLRPSRVLMSTRPCFGLEDVRGLRIGVPAIRLYHDIWQYLGARTVDVSFGQRKAAFEQGLIDATDVNFDVIISEDLYRQAPYVTLLNHSYSRACIIMTEKRWQTFRSDTRTAIQKAAEEVGAEYSNHLLGQYDNEKKLMLRHDMKFVEINTAPIREHVESLFLENARKNNWPIDLYNLINLL